MKAKRTEEEKRKLLIEYSKKYYWAHRDEVLEKMKAKRATMPIRKRTDADKRSSKKYRETHRDKVKGYMDAYYEKNKESISERKKLRNQERREATI
jgi:hypothetical protein